MPITTPIIPVPAPTPDVIVPPPRPSDDATGTPAPETTAPRRRRMVLDGTPGTPGFPLDTHETFIHASH